MLEELTYYMGTPIKYKIVNSPPFPPSPVSASFQQSPHPLFASLNPIIYAYSVSSIFQIKVPAGGRDEA
jgi:hypothetical protein